MVSKTKSLFLAIAFVIACSCTSNIVDMTDNIIPTPLEVCKKKGSFTVKKGISVSINDNKLIPVCNYLKSFFPDGYISFSESLDSYDSQIQIKLTKNVNIPGGYCIDISEHKIIIEGNDYEGVVSGITTLRQLLPESVENKYLDEVSIPVVKINDAPKFGWRGLHLDVSRHFYDKEEVKRLLSLMSLYKFNKFHWHLTDDQGWRIEIRQYPMLTEKGAWRKLNSHDLTCLNFAKENIDFSIPKDKIKIVEGDTIYGGFYTQDDIKEVVSFAAERGIDVIPEIDMPGHFLSAIDQYPDITCKGLYHGWEQSFSAPICVGSDKSIEFCKNIWKEVFELFPYEYAHIGGDEVEKSNWNKCLECKHRVHKENLKNSDALQAWFIKEMESFFNANGKILVGWDEVVEDGLNSSSVISWWRSWCGDAVSKATDNGMKAIICPNSYLYFDYGQKLDYIERIYNMNVYTDDLSKKQKDLVWGVQCNVWSEWIPSEDRMEYMIAPRMLAVSEIGWCDKTRRNDFLGFENKVMRHISRLDKMNVNYRIPDLTGFFNNNVFVEKGILNVDCKLPNAEIRYTTDGSIPTRESNLYQGPLNVYENTIFKISAFRSDGSKSDIYTAYYKKDNYSDDVKINKDLKPGLLAEWYDFSGSKCMEINKSQLKEKLIVSKVEIPKGVNGNIGLIFKGYINIPSDDVYTFSMLSDDGSILTIDSNVVINNDGLHSPEEVGGQIALSKGLHTIEVLYFDSNGGTLRLFLIDKDGNKIECYDDLFVH